MSQILKTWLDQQALVLNQTLVATGWGVGYALLDSGQGRKLEQFGPYVLNRPEPQAMWEPRLAVSRWEKADACFTGAEEQGNWRFLKDAPLPPWQVAYQNLRLEGQLTAFRHVGYFPEQLPHWRLIQSFVQKKANTRVLNLFAYTGMSSLIAAAFGATVTHVDASTKAIAWARKNQTLSQLTDAPIRWICEDAISFAAREVRRERLYDLILLDPPKFGRGPTKQVWDLYLHLPDLVDHCLTLLAPDGLLILNTYALRLSHLALAQVLKGAALKKGFDVSTFSVHSGELAIQEEGGGRIIPQSMFTIMERVL